MVDNLRNMINEVYSAQMKSAQTNSKLNSIISEEDPEDLFELLEQLGEGSFG
jgi:hypothetical protein